MANNFQFQGEVIGIAESVDRAVRRVRPIDLKINDKASLALGRISSSVKDFDKSLEAAQARTLAFGASVGIIAGVQKAFSELVKSTVAVEKSLIDINVVLGETQSGLSEFSTKLFKVAKNTGQSFKSVAEGALELSRQGLSGEETLKRLNSAMVLTRLSGLDAAAAVETLTATINGFTREGLSHVDIVNRMANVDAKFAVSSRDLAEALSRVGASAQDAGVSFNELLALVTSVQQQTARGGSVIGNSLKTIFTRIGRGGTLEQLEEFGVAIRDASGNARSAIDILESLASTYDKLGQSQQSSLAELVGGVYQINILKTLVRDLARDQGIYANALDVASKSTDQATKRNEELNKSLAALSNEALESLRELSAQVGNLSFGPAIRDLLKGFNTITSSITESLNGDETGQSFAKSFLKGFGNYLSGSGSVLILSIFLAILSKTASFVGKAIKETIGLNSQIERQQRLRLGINQLLDDATALERASIANATSLAEKQQIVNNLIRERIALQNMQNNASLSTAGGAIAKQFDYDESTKTFNQRQKFLRPKPPSFADGFVPSIMEEAAMIKRGVGGAKPLAKPVVLPNFNFGNGKKGTVIANTSEYMVPNYSNGGTAIFNQDMIKKYGLPKGAQKIAAGGYVPNSKTPIDLSKFTERQLRAMLSKGAQIRSSEIVKDRFGPADPKALTEKELVSVLNKLDLGPTDKERSGGRSIRQVVQSRLAGGNKALEQAIGSLVYKKISYAQAIATDELEKAQNNTPLGMQRLKEDLGKQELNKFQTGKRTRTVYSNPQAVVGPIKDDPVPVIIKQEQTAAQRAGGFLAGADEILAQRVEEKVKKKTKALESAEERVARRKGGKSGVIVPAQYDPNNPLVNAAEIGKVIAKEQVAQQNREIKRDFPNIFNKKSSGSTIPILQGAPNLFNPETFGSEIPMVDATASRSVRSSKVFGGGSSMFKASDFFDPTTGQIIPRVSGVLSGSANTPFATGPQTLVGQKAAESDRIAIRHLEEERKLRARIASDELKSLNAREAAEKRIEAIARRRLGISGDNTLLNKDGEVDGVLHNRLQQEKDFVRTKRAEAQTRLQGLRRDPRIHSRGIDPINAMISQMDNANTQKALTELRESQSGFLGSIGFGRPNQRAEAIASKRGLSINGTRALRDAGASAGFQQQGRLQNTILATAFGSSIASGFLPQASNSLNLGGAGLTLGSLIGPKGAAAGLAAGTTIGLIKDLGNLEKAIEGLSRTADRAASDNTILINSLQEYATAQGNLNQAIQAGSSNGVISSLTDNLNNAFKGIRDPKVRSDLVGAGGDPEKIADLISRQSVESQKKANTTALPLLIAQTVQRNQSILNTKRSISTQDEQDISRSISDSVKISPDALNKISELINSGTRDTNKLKEGFASTGLDTDTIDTLFDKDFLGEFPNTLASILDKVLLIAKADQGMSKLSATSKQLNASLADTSKTISKIAQKTNLRNQLQNISANGQLDRDSIEASGNLEISKTSLSEFERIAIASQINKNALEQKSVLETTKIVESIRQELLSQVSKSPRAEVSKVTDGLVSGSLSIDEVLKSLNLASNDGIVNTLKSLLAETIIIRAEAQESIKEEDLKAAIQTRLVLEESRSRLASTSITDNVGLGIRSTIGSRSFINGSSNATSLVKSGFTAQTSLSALKQAEESGVLLNSQASRLRGDLEAQAADAQLKAIGAQLINQQDEVSKALLDSVVNQLALLQGPGRADALKALTQKPEDRTIAAMDVFSKSITTAAELFRKSVFDFSKDLQILSNQEKRSAILKEGFDQEDKLSQAARNIKQSKQIGNDLPLSYQSANTIDIGSVDSTKRSLLNNVDFDNYTNAFSFISAIQDDAKKALQKNKQPSSFAEGESLDSYKSLFRSTSNADLTRLGFTGNLTKDEDIKAFITSEIRAAVLPFAIQSPAIKQNASSIASGTAEIDRLFKIDVTKNLTSEFLSSLNKQFSFDKDSQGEEKAAKTFKEDLSQFVASLDRRVLDLTYAKSQGANASSLPELIALRNSTANTKPVYTPTLSGGALESSIGKTGSAQVQANNAAATQQVVSAQEEARIKQAIVALDVRKKEALDSIAKYNQQILENDKQGLNIKGEYEKIDLRIAGIQAAIQSSSGIQAVLLNDQLELAKTQKEVLDEQVLSITSGNKEYKTRLRLQYELNRSRAERNLKETLADPLTTTDNIRAAYFDRGQTAIVGENGSTSESTFSDGFKSEMVQAQQSLLNFTEVGASAAATLKANLAGSFTDFVTGASSASEAIKGFGASVTKTLSQLATQKAVEFIFAAIFNGGAPTASSFSAPSSGPKTFNSGGSMLSSNAYKLSGMAKGGPVVGGSGFEDDILIAAMGGEYVINKEATKKHYALIKAINDGEKIEGYARGGMVGANRGSPVAANRLGSATGAGINVTINVTVTDGQATNTNTSASGGGMDAGQGTELGKMLRGVVVEEIINQQRPGGILSRR